jgi:hypothetical protein
MKRRLSQAARLLIFGIVAALLGVFPLVAILAQGSSTTGANAVDRILDAPYAAQRRVTSVKKSTDGTIKRSEASESEARDSRGRTYVTGERQWTYLEGKKKVLKSEMLYRIHDPVAKTDTKWNSSSKEVKVIHWPQSAPEMDDSSRKMCEAACLEGWMSPSDTVVEKLGVKTIAGVVAEGSRSSYAVAVGQDHKGTPGVVVQEQWYCPELKIVILETTDDPRTGSFRNELVNIMRGEPDVTRYQPPEDCVVREVQVPR